MTRSPGTVLLFLRTPASAQDWQPHRWGELKTMPSGTLSCVLWSLTNSHDPNESSSQASGEGKDDHFQSHLGAEETNISKQRLQQGHIQSSLHTLGFLESMLCNLSADIKLLPCLLLSSPSCVCSCVHTRYVPYGWHVDWLLLH